MKCFNGEGENIAAWDHDKGNMSKSQLPMPSFVGNTSSQASPPLCYPPVKSDKNETQQMTLCGCRKAPRSHCISAIGKWKLVHVNRKLTTFHCKHVTLPQASCFQLHHGKISFSFSARFHHDWCQTLFSSSHFQVTHFLFTSYFHKIVIIPKLASTIEPSWNVTTNLPHSSIFLFPSDFIQWCKATKKGFFWSITVEVKLVYNDELFFPHFNVVESVLNFIDIVEFWRWIFCFFGGNKWSAVEQPLKIH